VLNAFANVANVLGALELDAETLRVALCRTDRRTKPGDYPGAVSGGRHRSPAHVSTVRIALVIAQANRFAETVALFQSLVDGWRNRQDVVQVSKRGLDCAASLSARGLLLCQSHEVRLKAGS
jgi:hypothetical protein